MGMIVNGKWVTESISKWRENRGGVDDPAVLSALRTESGRFTVVASASCPWSHSVTMIMALKGLIGLIGHHIAHGRRMEGYAVNGNRPWRVPGCEKEIRHLHELYALGWPGYTGRASVPVLWDEVDRRIVSNESLDILRLLDTVECPSGPDFTLRPPDPDAAEGLAERIRDGLARTVYRAGLAETQDDYDRAVGEVFATLDMLETHLAERRYLFGPTIGETDWRLFAVLVRFDAVYFTHFRCSRRRLVDYPALWAYARDLMSWRGIAATVDFDAIREGYYVNDGDNNQHGIVGALPDADWQAPHGRDRLGPAQVLLRGGNRMDVDPTTLAQAGEKA